MAGAAAAAVMSADISRRNPQDDYELIQRIGSGTYGDVYKVSKCPAGLQSYKSVSRPPESLITTFIPNFIVQ